MLKMNAAGVYKISRFLYLKNIPILPKVLMSLNRMMYACDIPYKANIHPTVRFGHNALGVVINPNSSIGEGTLILQHVTVGGNRSKRAIYEGEEINSPIIGENVFIGPGAKILGPLIIGDNAQIGAGAVVLEDVPRNAIAVGIPAKTIKILQDHEVIKAD